MRRKKTAQKLGKSRTKFEAIDSIPAKVIKDKLKDVKKVLKDASDSKKRSNHLPARGTQKELKGELAAGLRVDHQKKKKKKLKEKEMAENDAMSEASEVEMDPEEALPMQKKVPKERVTKEQVKEFLQAASKGDLQSVKDCLVKHKALSLHSKDEKSGLTALLIACAKNQLVVARWLLFRGADIKAADKVNGWTALMYACKANASEIVDLLLQNQRQAKAIVKANSSTGITCLHALAMNPESHVDTARKLVKAGAVVQTMDNKMMSPLAYALKSGCSQEMKAFLSQV